MIEMKGVLNFWMEVWELFWLYFISKISL